MTVVIRPVASRSGPVTFAKKISKRVDLTKPYGIVLRKRWEQARQGQPKRNWITTMGFTITPQENKTQPAAVAVPVPDDVAADLATLWDHIVKHPGFTAHVKFEGADLDEQAKTFLAQARTWANTQEAANKDGDKGPLIFRQLPSKDAPDDEIRFALNAQPTKAEREAKKAAKKKREEKKAAEAAKAATEKPAADAS